MRTTTLLCAVAAGAAGLVSAVAAEVYSVNAVGYVNTPLKAGFNLVSTPLNAGANKVSEVMPTAPEGTLLYTFSAATGFSVIQYDGEWLPSGDTVVAPGTGYFMKVGAAATVTYVGEVPQGELVIPLVAGFNLVGSKVPQAGKLQADLKYTPADGDLVYTFDTAAGYSVFQYDAEWLPSEPALTVGQGIWIKKAAAGSWTRTFSVNTP
jgi:hypothetical protein